jgi:DNA oxidative demethylase
MSNLFAPEPLPLGAAAFYLPGFAQSLAHRLLAELPALLAQSPLRTLYTPGGRPFSVRSSNAGNYGWISDQQGYRYSTQDPLTQRPWPALPASFTALATEAAAAAGFAGFIPQACLINLYSGSARMALHQDNDEPHLAAPIVSVSLGASAYFLWGGQRREDRAQRLLLQHGDLLVWGGEDRLRFHGIERLVQDVPAMPAAERAALLDLAGTPQQYPRINLTFRQIYPADQ